MCRVLDLFLRYVHDGMKFDGHRFRSHYATFPLNVTHEAKVTVS